MTKHMLMKLMAYLYAGTLVVEIIHQLSTKYN